MVMWFITMIVFVAFPFVTSKRRRVLCMRGIRERRWIPDEEWEQEWENENPTSRQRQQQREENQRRFQTTRTQEDSIRQQYLAFLMERYTVELKESDIHDADDMATSEEFTESTDDGKEQTKNDVENQCDATVISSEVGSSKDTIDTDQSNKAGDTEAPPALVRENRADSEDSEDLLACEFEKGQTISVPLAGHSNEAEKNRRSVSNGCAICLCQFEAGEQLTYSSNPDCCHVFHNECIINWYLAVGRKTQRRRKKNNPNMTDEEALDLICDFPINCPCCRQPFSTDSALSCEKANPSDDERSEGADDALVIEEV